MTRSKSSTVKGKNAQARHQAQAKGAQARHQAQAKSAQARQQAQAKSSAMKQQAQARSAKMRSQAQARSAQMREQAARSGPARQARRAATSVAPIATRIAPIAMGVGLSTRKGVRRLRMWAAPQLEQAGHALEDRVAPRIAESMIAAARQIEPPSRRPRIRWAAFAAGSAAIAAGGAATAYLLSRRSSQPSEVTPAPEPVTSPAAGQEARAGEPASRS